MDRFKRKMSVAAEWFSKLLCPHRYQLWVRNIYGDGILYSGGKRSEWKCQTCGRSLFHPFLFKSTSKP